MGGPSWGTIGKASPTDVKCALEIRRHELAHHKIKCDQLILRIFVRQLIGDGGRPPMGLGEGRAGGGGDPKRFPL